jgi:hypothetical protein
MEQKEIKKKKIFSFRSNWLHTPPLAPKKGNKLPGRKWLAILTTAKIMVYSLFLFERSDVGTVIATLVLMH